MAQQLETMERPGEMEGDIETWLAKNRLTKYKDKFHEDEATLEDLLTWDEETIQNISTEYGMTSTIVKQRFKTAVRTLQRGAKSSKSSHQIYRIVTSIKESQSIQSIENMLSKIQIAISNNANATSISLENCTVQIDEIARIFKSLEHQLNERKKALQAQITCKHNDQLSGLKTQQNVLTNYENVLKKAKDEADALILDPQMDAETRENKIIQICDDATRSIQQEDLNSMSSKIHMVINEKAISEYIAQIGDVGFVPSPPILHIKDITLNSAKVQIECKDKESSVVQSTIECKLEINDDEKGEWAEYNHDGQSDFEITKLRDHCDYCVRVKCKTDKNHLFSGYSEVQQFKTLQLVEPSVKITDIRCRTVTVVLEMDDSVTGEISEFTIECKLGNNEDEKQDWEIYNYKDTKECQLNDLQPETDHCIRVRYKTKEVFHWSNYSQIVKFKTRKKLEDTFDPQNVGTDMRLTASNTIVTKENDSNYRSVLLSHVINGRNKYHWQFKILCSVGSHWNPLIVSSWNPLIGIRKTSFAFKHDTYFTNTTNNGYAYYNCNNKGMITNPSEPGHPGQAYGNLIKTGDVIDMFVDMNALTLSYHHNGSDCGKAFDIDRTEYKAAVTFYSHENSIQLVSFDRN
eukprot:511932_1